MRASTLNILDSLEAPLLDYINGYETDDGAAQSQPQPQRQPPEKPASSLDSKGLLKIFGSFLRPGAHG